MNTAEILQRLQHIEELQQVPEQQLRWWVETSKYNMLNPGDFLFRPGEEANHLFVILEGRLEIFLTTEAGKQGQMELVAPTLTGVLPFSRMTHASGTGVALTPVAILAFHRENFPELVKDHYALTQGLVHFMTSRVRTFTRQTLQNEKMMALGKLSAGLAHELNNPSAAIVQSSRSLNELIGKMPALL
jgi:CRP-like cAMP-binding protein